jgi:hypothetical protein
MRVGSKIRTAALATLLLVGSVGRGGDPAGL